MRGCWNRQTGKLEVLVSVLACGFKSHFPHQCKGHSIFRVSFIFCYESPQITIILKSTLESHEIFDFVEAELVPQHEIFDLVEAELVPQSDKASHRCPGQYWRVGSSPISRTSVKDIRFFECPLFFAINCRKSLSF